MLRDIKEAVVLIVAMLFAAWLLKIALIAIGVKLYTATMLAGAIAFTVGGLAQCYIDWKRGVRARKRWDDFVKDLRMRAEAMRAARAKLVMPPLLEKK